MRNGSDKGFIYWKLNYKKKFIRTLWMIPVGVLVILLLFATSASTQTITILSVIFFVVLLIQLIYTYSKWKKEPISS